MIRTCLMLARKVSLGLSVLDQVDLGKSSDSQLLDHPVVGAELGHGTRVQLHGGLSCQPKKCLASHRLKSYSLQLPT